MIMYARFNFFLLIYLKWMEGEKAFTMVGSGLLLLPGAVINAFLSPITGKMYDRIRSKTTLYYRVGDILLFSSVWGRN